MSEDTWTITNNCHSPEALRHFNSVFTICNGYLGLNGNLSESHGTDCPLTIINGIYDERDVFGDLQSAPHEQPWLDPDCFDSAGPSPAVANLPAPLFVRAYLDDRVVEFGKGELSGFRQELDLRCGCYHCAYDYRDGGAGARIEMWRFASLVEPHRAYMRYRIIPQNKLTVRILSGIRAAPHSDTRGTRQFSTEHVEVVDGMCGLRGRTPTRQHVIQMEVQHHIGANTRPTAMRGRRAPDTVFTEFEFTVQAQDPVIIDRLVALHSSEGARHGGRLPADAGAAGSFDAALAKQRAAWSTLWERADVQIDGDETAQRYLRFCLHHLLAAAPRFSDKLSVPAKLLSGAHYQGNTFYDTDLYIVPFYTFTFPEHARTCLNWRYAGLDKARDRARQLGCAGAKFAWQAGPYGEECLGNWHRFGRTNIHVNAAVAYSLMQYYRATGDQEFMQSRGVDVLVESARFYASRAEHDRRHDIYDFSDVAGPDEAHCRSSSNFYTNYLAQRTLRWAAEMLASLRRVAPDAYAETARRLTLADEDPARWRRIADRITLLFDSQTRIYEQCAGFHRLPPPPGDLLDKRDEWFVPLFKYRALNQPDVLMAMALFRDEFDEKTKRANWKYYNPLSMNFSSMSYAVNAIMAADVGAMDEAYRNFIICAGMDLDESLTGRHDTHAGLHGTAMGGAWLAAVCGFGGVRMSEGGLRIDPRLPPQWRGLRFNLVLRGEVVRVAVDREEVTLDVGNERGIEIPVRIGGQALTLKSGEEHRIRYQT